MVFLCLITLLTPRLFNRVSLIRLALLTEKLIHVLSLAIFCTFVRPPTASSIWLASISSLPCGVGSYLGGATIYPLSSKLTDFFFLLWSSTNRIIVMIAVTTVQTLTIIASDGTIFYPFQK